LPGPENKEELDGEAEDGQPGIRVVTAGIIHGHLDVGGEDGYQQGDDQPGCDPAGGDWQQQEGEGYFTDPTDIDHGKVIGDIRGHNALVHAGMPKVVDAGEEIEDDHAVEGEELHGFKFQGGS
jgi:hypothetical protein